MYPMYRRKIAGSEPKYKKPVWICQTFNRLGKQFCVSKQIPEDILKSVTASVLGMEAFDAGLFERQIERIRVIGPNQLLFLFRDGRRISREWQDASRKWSDAQKKAARNRYYDYLERSQTHARAYALASVGGVPLPPDKNHHVGRYGTGLHPHRPRQGVQPHPGRFPTWAAQRADAGGDSAGDDLRRYARRRDHHRKSIWSARLWQYDPAGHAN